MNFNLKFSWRAATLMLYLILIPACATQHTRRYEDGKLIESATFSSFFMMGKAGKFSSATTDQRAEGKRYTRHLNMTDAQAQGDVNAMTAAINGIVNLAGTIASMGATTLIPKSSSSVSPGPSTFQVYPPTYIAPLPNVIITTNVLIGPVTTNDLIHAH